ncbi:energy transducer TonB [Gimesia maris]|uniref:energy transducer TonB n=1 Tax=Gimesia maris TaxID=122 RepID=UPI003A8E5A1D
MSNASESTPRPTDEPVDQPLESWADDTVRDGEVTSSGSDVELALSGEVVKGHETDCTGVKASPSVAGTDPQSVSEFRHLAIRHPSVDGQTAPPWSLAFVISVVVHCIAFAFVAQWSIQKTRWLLDVERGESAAIQLTASFPVPSLPSIKFAELIDDEPIQIDPALRESLEQENQPRAVESTRGIQMPLLKEPDVEIVARNQSSPMTRRTFADEMPKVATIPPPVVKRIRLAPPPPTLTAPDAPSAVRSNERVGANIDTPPRKLPDNPPPEYPESARQAGHEGRVILLANINSSGEVVDVAVASSCGYPLLDEAAMRSVLKWKFEPAFSEGNPTATEIRVPVRFSLRHHG